jgi:hypothetical protein
MFKRLIVLSSALIAVTVPSLPQEDTHGVSGLDASPRGRQAWICPPSRSVRWAMP